MKKFIGVLLWIIVIVIIIVVGFINYLSMNNYRPDDVEALYENSEETPVISIYDTLSIMSWNIGYCGLDEYMDFFFDGGEQTRTSYEQTVENWNNIKNELERRRGFDFYLFQEVDFDSKRSYHINQYDSIVKLFDTYSNIAATNYMVKYIPFPLSDPLGKVNSGLLTTSIQKVFDSKRHAYQADFSWPKRIFMLDRCFIVNRYKLSNQKELLIINTHNTAFDDGGIRKEQLGMLKEFVMKQFDVGNYVIIGGDWNQCPPGIEPDRFSEIPESEFKLISVDGTLFPENWNFVYDKAIPTNRYLNMAYEEGKTAVTVLDFFLVSPNIEIIEKRTFNLKFKYSDHNPIFARFILN